LDWGMKVAAVLGFGCLERGQREKFRERSFENCQSFQTVKLLILLHWVCGSHFFYMTSLFISIWWSILILPVVIFVIGLSIEINSLIVSSNV
jgi:hypothetical protein